MEKLEKGVWVLNLQATDWLTSRKRCGKSRGLQVSTLRMMRVGEFRKGMCLEGLAGLGS